MPFARHKSHKLANMASKDLSVSPILDTARRPHRVELLDLLCSFSQGQGPNEAGQIGKNPLAGLVVPVDVFRIGWEEIKGGDLGTDDFGQLVERCSETGDYTRVIDVAERLVRRSRLEPPIAPDGKADRRKLLKARSAGFALYR